MLSIRGGGGIPSGVPGVFLNEGRIISVTDISGTKPEYYSNPVDIGVELKLEIGRSFQPTLRIAKNFKHDDKGNIVDWGAAFPLREFLEQIGGTKLDDNYRIPAELLEAIVGKDIIRLSYVTGVKEGGKLKYKDWDRIMFKGSGDPLALAKRFIDEYKRTGYPKNYHPEAIEEVSAAAFDFPVPDESEGPDHGL